MPQGEIRRYTPAVSGEEPCIDEFVGMKLDDCGSYVLHYAHASQLADYARRLSAAEGELERVTGEAGLLRVELESARSDAVCHCGALLHEHTLSDNHSPVPMEHPCPNAKPLEDVRATLAYESRDFEAANELLRAEVERLRADYLEVVQAVGVVHQADGHEDHPGPVEDIVREVRRLQDGDTKLTTAVLDNLNLRATLARTEARMGKLLALLRENEWDGVHSRNGDPACMECGFTMDNGHAPDCRLAAAINDKEPT